MFRRWRPAAATLLAAALVGLLTTACSGPEPAANPNLILIVADDLGFGDLGFMGSPHVETPNLDRLAAEGTVFSQGQHAASICRPSLRALLTGLDPYQWKHRVQGLRPGYEMQELGTLPRLLASAGYTSFQAGKIWEAGYDVAGFSSGMNPPGEASVRGGRGATLGRDSIESALDFVEVNRDRPFFLWFVPKLPHTPHDAGPVYRRRYEGMELSGDAVGYYANITRFDTIVGELLTRIDDLGLTRHTLVVFLSDNGWEQRPHVRRDDYWDGARGKRTLHEIGFRTPIVLRLPGRIPAGRRLENIVSTLDLFPTLLAYAGLEVPPDRAGTNLEPLISDRASPSPGAVIGWMADPRVRAKAAVTAREGFFLRERDWRYIWYPELDRDELYAIRSDPAEATDVSHAQPALVQELRKRIRAWESEMRRADEADDTPSARLP